MVFRGITIKGEDKLLTAGDSVIETFSFSEAMDKVLKGTKVSRIDWNQNAFVNLAEDGALCIHINGQKHTFILRDLDISAIDWYALG